MAYFEKIPLRHPPLFIVNLGMARAIQAIELWTTLVEVELDEDDADNKNLVKQALPGLVPVLLETLTKQEDGQDMDENAWNLSTAGGTCLGSVATLVTDDIVPIVAPFIQVRFPAVCTMLQC